MLKTNAGYSRRNLRGVVDPIMIDVVVRKEDTINSTAVIRPLKQIEDKDLNAETIYFIFDSAQFFRGKEVAKWLETSRIEMDCLPPYFLNANIVESPWKYFPAEVM